MITYELAKKLKDAGFPQEPYRDGKGFSHKQVSLEGGDLVKIPYLEDLIDACGDKLGRVEHVMMRGVEETWISYSSKVENKLDIAAYIVQQGSTPSEAIANLWLALNK